MDGHRNLGAGGGGGHDALIGNAVLACGLAAGAALVLHGGATSAISRSIYIYIDLPGFWVAGAIIALSTLLGAVRPVVQRIPSVPGLAHVQPWHVAVAVLAAVAVSIDPVYHGYALSMDEYMTRFQAEIFSAGRLAGEVPPEWRSLGRALHHDFARFDPVSGLVYSSYRPGMAALTAAFDLVGLGRYTSAVMSAGSVILVASIARQMWPRNESAPLVAALILGTSQQVLIAGLTAYAMPAHLFFNLLWLRLFLADRPWAHGLAALVGVATASLHQVHTHVFFAAPFLLTLFRPRRPRLLLWYGAVYLVGHAAIIGWDRWAIDVASGTGAASVGLLERIEGILRIPGGFELGSVSALLVRMAAWQNLAMVPLLVIAVRRAEWTRELRLLAASVAVSLLPYLLLMPDQGHGWGYRYLHGLIGNLALIATAGWLAVRRMPPLDRRRVSAPLALAGILSVLVMLPFRALQVEAAVRPFAAALHAIRSSTADVVVVDTPTIYYGQDLVRNDPFLRNRPVVLDIRHLSAPQVERLCRSRSVALIGADALVRFGLVGMDGPDRPPRDWRRMRALLASPACKSR